MRVQCPRRRLQGPGRRCGGQSRAVRLPGSQSRRGTRLTLGPSAEPEEASGRPAGRVSDRTMVRVVRPERWHSSSVDPERKRGALMRKQTTPRTRQHRQVSSPEQSGLIVQGDIAQQSATPTAALDNHSHRTTTLLLRRRGLGGSRSPTPEPTLRAPAKLAGRRQIEMRRPTPGMRGILANPQVLHGHEAPNPGADPWQR